VRPARRRRPHLARDRPNAPGYASPIPVGVFIVVLAGVRRWWWAALVGFAASCTIELCQLLFLSSRFATLNDVIANTSGAVVSALLGLILLILAEIARPRRP